MTCTFCSIIGPSVYALGIPIFVLIKSAKPGALGVGIEHLHHMETSTSVSTKLFQAAIDEITSGMFQ